MEELRDKRKDFIDSKLKLYDKKKRKNNSKQRK